MWRRQGPCILDLLLGAPVGRFWIFGTGIAHNLHPYRQYRCSSKYSIWILISGCQAGWRLNNEGWELDVHSWMVSISDADMMIQSQGSFLVSTRIFLDLYVLPGITRWDFLNVCTKGLFHCMHPCRQCCCCSSQHSISICVSLCCSLVVKLAGYWTTLLEGWPVIVCLFQSPMQTF